MYTQTVELATTDNSVLKVFKNIDETKSILEAMQNRSQPIDRSNDGTPGKLDLSQLQTMLDKIGTPSSPQQVDNLATEIADLKMTIEGMRLKDPFASLMGMTPKERAIA